MAFINPKTDYAFKKIFGSTQSKELLISFLNALLYEAQPIIENLEILTPHQPAIIQGLKDTYLDVKAQLNNGTLVIIEMQVLNVAAFGKRILSNAAKAYVLQLEAGESYMALKPVIALTITDFIMFEKRDPVISHFVYQEKSDHFIYPEPEIELVFVELPKFNKTVEELETVTDKWIYFMKFARMLETVPSTMGNIPEIQKAFEMANKANLTREELEELDKREIFIQDQRGVMIKSREEGAKEKAREIAKQLLNVLDEETISRTTGLTLEEIQALREQ